jgi:LIVCS family branched-chain amino acid:cation transporter
MQKIHSNRLAAWVQSPVISTTLAMFAMFFGSGNIVLPLGLGKDLGNMAIYAMLGFFATAVMVPVVGILAMALFNGDYRAFMARIGKIPAAIVIFICFALIGPFCIIPRCIALSHAALQWLIPQLTLLQFSIIAAVLIFITTARKSGVVPLMSRVLGPLKLVLLSLVIVKGLFMPTTIIPCALPGWNVFKEGLFAGYNTLDLLAVIFSTGLLLSGVTYDAAGHKRSQRDMMKILVKAGICGALLLGLFYAGFVIVSSMQSGAAVCMGAPEEQLLSILAAIILGAGGGVLASVTMAIACSTTAIGVTTIFAEYLSTELPNGWLSYRASLFITTVLSAILANYGWMGIKNLVIPVIFVLYPGLIVLALTHITERAFRVYLGSLPFYLTIACTCILRMVR